MKKPSTITFTADAKPAERIASSHAPHRHEGLMSDSALPLRVLAPDADMIEGEPMLYQASIAFARKHGGRITNRILDHLRETRTFDKDILEQQLLHGRTAKIDTKSILLQPGQLPCIGGWHCDMIPRRKNGTVKVYKINTEKAPGYLLSFCTAGLICPTQFLSRPLLVAREELERSRLGVWGHADLLANAHLPRVGTTTNGELIRFTSSDLHRGTPAEGSGWRFFFRLIFTDTPPTDKIRKQVQVYTTSVGW
jgi:hypothetical protein